ncbi:hypothetical protein ABZW96_00270 [Nocardia sp. NPDC004168]
MSAVIFVLAFVCCALVIRAFCARAQTPRLQPVRIEADDVRR